MGVKKCVHWFVVHRLITRCCPVRLYYVHIICPTWVETWLWAEMFNVRSWVKTVISYHVRFLCWQVALLLWSFLFLVLALTLLPLAPVSPWAERWLLPTCRILFERPHSRDVETASGARSRKKSFLSFEMFWHERFCRIILVQQKCGSNHQRT